MRSAKAGSSEAATEVAGRYRANSAAMLGPERTPRGQSHRGGPAIDALPPRTSAMIWVGRRRVLFSMPLATETMGRALGIWGARRCQTARMYWVGTAETANVAPAK